MIDTGELCGAELLCPFDLLHCCGLHFYYSCGFTFWQRLDIRYPVNPLILWMCIISRLGDCIISQRVPCVNWKPLFLEETMATGVFILQEHYVIQVTIINYLLALWTSPSPKEFFSPTPSPLSVPKPKFSPGLHGLCPLMWGIYMQTQMWWYPAVLDSWPNRLPVPSTAVMALAPGFAAEGDTLLKVLIPVPDSPRI